jgi:hypothetical protein
VFPSVPAYEREEANRLLERAAAIGETRLAERALKLGIGRGQLNRILRSLEEGAPLSKDDATRCHELLGGFSARAAS